MCWSGILTFDEDMSSADKVIILSNEGQGENVNVSSDDRKLRNPLNLILLDMKRVQGFGRNLVPLSKEAQQGAVSPHICKYNTARKEKGFGYCLSAMSAIIRPGSCSYNVKQILDVANRFGRHVACPSAVLAFGDARQSYLVLHKAGKF